MLQWRIEYIAHNDRSGVCYLFANTRDEVEKSASILQGCKRIVLITLYEK